MSIGSAAKTPQVALAIFAVIATPAIVGAATTSTEPNGEAAKPEAVKLSAQLSGDEKGANGTAKLLLAAKGPAPAAPAVLTGDGGRTVVTARRTEAAACDGLEPRQATGTEQATLWCLQLSNLNDGDEVTGTLSGAGTTVELTATRRNPYLGWPILLALVGLVIGAAVILVPRLLRNGIRKATLDKTLALNAAAGPERGVAGLTEWVTDRRQAGDSDDALLPIVAGVIRRAPLIAARARAELAATANRLREVLEGHDALVAADGQARRTDHQRAEFIDDDGEAVAHPAKAWTALLEDLGEARRDLDVARLAIDALPAGASKEAAQQALADAVGAYRAADEPAKGAAVQDAVAKVDRLVATAQAQASAAQGAPPPIAIIGGRRRPFAATAPTVVHSDDVTAAPAVPPAPSVAGATIMALVALTVIVSVGVAAWALASLWLTVYEPKAAFGGIDYATLLVGAVGSGAAGAILTLVSAWDPLSPAEAD